MLPNVEKQEESIDPRRRSPAFHHQIVVEVWRGTSGTVGSVRRGAPFPRGCRRSRSSGVGGQTGFVFVVSKVGDAEVRVGSTTHLGRSDHGRDPEV